MDLELLSHEITSSHTCVVTVRRRTVFVGDPTLPVPRDADGNPTVAVDEAGLATRVLSPAGAPIRFTLERSPETETAWQLMLDAQTIVRAQVETLAEAHFDAIAKSPQVLDEKIAAAEAARAFLAKSKQQITDAEARLAELAAATAAKTTE